MLPISDGDAKQLMNRRQLVDHLRLVDEAGLLLVVNYLREVQELRGDCDVDEAPIMRDRAALLLAYVAPVGSEKIKSLWRRKNLMKRLNGAEGCALVIH